jgi:hypothetical protein
MTPAPTRSHPSPLRADPAVAGLCSEKLRGWHRERLAVVYIRQSTPQQVLVHGESTRLQ